jgi:hypothetical protein
MDLTELQRALDAAGIRPDTYDLDPRGFSLPSERYCIRQEGPARWVTYYSERGHRNREGIWITEDEACRSLLDLLMHDRTVRRLRGGQ